MKKIISIVCCSLVLLLSGCSGYSRDTSAGKLEAISVAKMQEKIDNKESFAVVFTQTACGHCINFQAMVTLYLENHNVTVYDVVLDNEEETKRDSNLQLIRKTFPGMNTTPSLYYVKDGKMDNVFENGSDGITEAKFDSWVQNYQLDKKTDK
ncbi:MAG: thioredoxin [Longicatena sp.]